MSRNSRAQLAKLREMRKAGKTGFDDFIPGEEEQLYDEIDDEKYKEVLRGRLEEDFVVDDNGEGYVDDGREESYDSFSGTDDGEPDGKEKGRKGKDKAKRKKEAAEKQAKERDRIKNGITKYFQGKPGASAVPKAAVAATADDDAFMADLLGEVAEESSYKVSAVPKPTRPKIEPRKAPVIPPPAARRAVEPSKPRAEPQTSTTVLPTASALGAKPRSLKAAAEAMAEDDEFMMQMDDDIDFQDFPSSPVPRMMDRKARPAAAVKAEPDDDEFEMSDLEVGEAFGAVVKPRQVKQEEPPVPSLSPKREAVLPSSSPTRPPPVSVDASQWTSVTENLNIQQGPAFDAVPFGKLAPPNVLEEDGSLHFYWLDYTEVNGALCLFGKVKDKSSGRYESSFVKVDNILRKLYFLPRETNRKTKRPVTEDDLMDEVDVVMSRLKVTEHKSKMSKRRYAFELSEIPHEAEYLKVLYSYEKPMLGTDEIAAGDTYSHVFGANTGLFEQFVLWKNIMGPCWLRLENPDFQTLSNVSWCKLEVSITKPAGISPLGRSEDEQAPPLTVMSIAMRTAYNLKDNKQEIILISARVYENLSISEVVTAESLPCRTFSIVRPVEPHFPVGFRLEAQKHTGSIHQEQSEGMVLSKFMAIIQHLDPDVLTGHKLDEVGIGLLLSRMKERNTPSWHRLGRLRRRNWPRQLGRGHGSMFAERMIVSGRLICDLANDMGKSAMPQCQTWSLSEMTNLGIGAMRSDIDEEAALKTWATKPVGLMNFIRHCETDTYFVAAIAIKTQLLPLTKVLTNLAGNSWARTLTGTRAERNEFILLHDFYRLKYICPDKRGPGMPQAASGIAGPGQTGDGAEGEGKKKDKYQGGLVFEPEKGLYDEYVLVMDFNSLYPSIIQEFNICFTTVERANLDSDTVPEVPAVQELGVLPRLISTLVNRRREVKKLMSSKSATEDEKMTWNIKQLALKLTANSMYGCLGYVRSRFYARPLAMLTTSKGREILRSTKELAEKQDLQVIYGDTDSVMINSHTKSLPDALTVGREFKKAVNDQYRLLEIDIDAIFRRLLLHAKKKYAAITVPVDPTVPNPPGKLDVKGLDMKRREFCALSKETSAKLLEFLLSGEDPEDVVHKIHNYLRELATKMRAFEIPVTMYTIHTQLGKNPKEYDGTSANAPAVQVALRELSRGKVVKAKDVMSFIMTESVKEEGEDENVEVSKKKASADGIPYTVADVLRDDLGLRPKIEYYLAKQILPPVERLCAPISGTNSARLAECLGLDPSRYNSGSASRSAGPAELQPLESQIPDAQRFKDALPPIFRCRSCAHTFPFRGLGDGTSLKRGLVGRDGFRCPDSKCLAVLPPYTLAAQLEAQIRQHAARYYAGWAVCNDPACGIRTRQISVAGGGGRCLGPRGLASGCSGRMQMEYSEKQMYNQLLYLQRLFDVDTTIRKAREGKLTGGAADGDGDGDGDGAAGPLSAEERERVVVLASQNRERFGALYRVVQGYLDKNGRQWVDMGALFAFAAPALA